MSRFRGKIGADTPDLRWRLLANDAQIVDIDALFVKSGNMDRG